MTSGTKTADTKTSKTKASDTEKNIINHMDRLELRLPTMDAPMRWANAGWQDMLRRPFYSFGYGAIFTFGGLLLVWFLYDIGWTAAIPMMAGGFTLIGPFFAIGLYAMSRRFEEGTDIDFSVTRPARFAEPRQLAYVALAMVLCFLLWSLIALFLFAIFTNGHSLALNDFIAFVLTTPKGLSLLAMGTVLGGVIALFVFAFSALSIPILLEHEVDAMTAMTASLRVMIEAPGPMLAWAMIVAIYTFFGVATLFFGLIVVFPMMGHATWHAYRDIVKNPPYKA
ncbi:hypothetical protein MNBD_ALPHA06-1814 [hydrothermal vent metagenome]|uniref:Cytochrome c oxidase, subunit I n=1 Tax=hydrothermal vent metagenome TaxID=652676 RepID=A0A3B0RW20_9ZZZZ